MTTDIEPDGAGLARVVELERQGRYARALRLIAATGPSADTPAFQAARCRLLSSQGRLVEALATIDLAADRWPGVASVLAARAEVLTSCERNAEAIADADRAIELDDADPVAYKARAMALCSLGEREEALRAAMRAVALSPDDPDSEFGVVMVLCETSPAGALAHADDLVRHRGDGWALALRAMTRFTLELDGSADDAHAAVRLEPDNEAARVVALLADMASERWDEVIAGSLAELLRDTSTRHS
jgi:tetratricopeptide (TPR) repeat protein